MNRTFAFFRSALFFNGKKMKGGRDGADGNRNIQETAEEKL